MQKSNNFGTMLYFLRVTYAQRVARAGTAVKRKKTQADLIECMEQIGYTISAGAYSEIEAGTSFPRDVEAFLEAVAHCLALDEKEQDRLRWQLAYDIIVARVSEAFARQVFGPPPQP